MTPGRMCSPAASMVLPALVPAEAADRHDTAVLHADIGKTFAGMIDEGRALDKEIEGFWQDEAFA